MKRTSTNRGTLRRAPLLLAIVLASGCEPTLTPEPPIRTLRVVGGADQEAGAGTPLSLPVTVALLGPEHEPLAGAEVRWQIIEGAGIVSDRLTLTDSLGQATVRWTLGSTIGPQLLLALAEDASVTVRATARFEIVSLAVGPRHNCAISTTLETFCWGANGSGQLGDGTISPFATPSPVRVRGPGRFRTVAAGWSHTCAVSELDTTYCWGDDRAGQLGLGEPTGLHPLPVPTPTGEGEAPLVSLTAGFVHTCGMEADGDAVCWGGNGGGQLGAATGHRVRTPGLGIEQISAGEFHTCGIRVGGELLCWGWNSLGELGIGAPFGLVQPTPTPVAGDERYGRVAGGIRHTCAVSTEGTVLCWGRSSDGEIGRPPFHHQQTPVPVPETRGYARVATGNVHTCGISEGRLRCWGALPGDEQATRSQLPVPVPTELEFVDVGAGSEHSCALTAVGEVWCWGSNAFGQLGVEELASSAVPLRVLFPGSR